jgi:hypothetical protein
VEFVGDEFVTVTEARTGAVVRSVTELVSTRVDIFPAESFSQTERTFAFSVEETVKVAGTVPAV